VSDLLTLDDVVGGYGSARVLNGVSFEVRAGEVAVILGANGVGKTTTLRAIAGLKRIWSGRITLDGRGVGRASPEKLVRMGVATVPEPPGVFRDMSVVHNLRVGGFALARGARLLEERIAWAFAAFPILERRKHQLAGSLSGGEQRLLAVARAMIAQPRLLLVDEVSMGLAPTMVTSVFAVIAKLRREEGVAVCMVEQNVAALDISDRAYVMEKGRIVHEAGGEGLSRARDEAIRAYLGPGSRTARKR